jgi:AcrR family transcriptional regulator
VTLRDIIHAGGLSTNSIYNWYGSTEELYERAVSDEIAALALLIRPPLDFLTVEEAIGSYAETCAGLFRSERYRSLLFLVVRDGATRAWLPRKHQREIIERMEYCLGEVVVAAGKKVGRSLEVRSSICQRFVKRLQSELSLPMLVPLQKEPTNRAVRLLAEAAAAEAAASVYSVESIRAAVGEMARSSIRAPRIQGDAARGRPAAGPDMARPIGLRPEPVRPAMPSPA